MRVKKWQVVKGCWGDGAEPQLGRDSTLSRSGVHRSREGVKQCDVGGWKENGEFLKQLTSKF